MTRLNKYTSLGMICMITENRHILKGDAALYNMLKNLETLATNELVDMPPVTGAERKQIGDKLVGFVLDMKWAGQVKQVGNALSFAKEKLEDEDVNPVIVETINSIIEHLENGGKLKTANCWAGSIAADRWNEIVKEDPDA